MSPIQQQTQALENAFQYYNDTLFFGKLSPCMFSISASSVGKGVAFAAAFRWVESSRKNKKLLHEIGLNPKFFAFKPIDAFSILVHEMVHVWQFEFGKSGRYKYHNKEWGFKMKEVGLIPSDTGLPGGKVIGEKMVHYIEEKGRYEEAFKKMPKSCLLPFQLPKSGHYLSLTTEKPLKIEGEATAAKTRNRNKITYTCKKCGTNIWGKANLKVRCENCNILFTLKQKKKT